MKKIVLSTMIFLFLFTTYSFSFYLYIGQDKSEVVAAIGEPNYIEEYVDSSGKVEKYQ
jgi:hypothetical protein